MGGVIKGSLRKKGVRAGIKRVVIKAIGWGKKKAENVKG